MVSRKQTPDVLSEILGGEPVPTPPAPATPAKPKARSAPASRPRRPAGPKKTRWEYMEVVFRDYGGYRPRYVNGQEQAGWKRAPVIHEYLNQVGEEGWELVGVGSRHNEQVPAYFKRPRA